MHDSTPRPEGFDTRRCRFSHSKSEVRDCPSPEDALSESAARRISRLRIRVEDRIVTGHGSPPLDQDITGRAEELAVHRIVVIVHCVFLSFGFNPRRTSSRGNLHKERQTNDSSHQAPFPALAVLSCFCFGLIHLGSFDLLDKLNTYSN